MDTGLVIVPTAITDPDAVRLIDAMTVEVSALYGTTPGRNRLDSEHFAPPDGLFLVAYVAERAVGCAGYRKAPDGDQLTAQMHRVFVEQGQRGQGVSRRLLLRLEKLAAAAGYETMRLETGERQPAATRLYQGLGYELIPCFAPYENDPSSRCYAKRIG